MSFPGESQPVIRFGEFQLDLETAELRRNGDKSSVQGQPLQILTMLVENPGRMVTREELKKKLWPSDTFVDFDQSLNRAVNRLREALGDSAEKPRYIETLPRRGYRFIGSVSHQGLQTTAYDSVAAETSSLQARIQRESSKEDSETLHPNLPSYGAGTLAIRILLTASVVTIAVVVWWVYHHRRSSTTPGPIQSLAVLPLENLSGDPAQEYFAEGMTDELITDLAVLSKVRIISRTSIMQYSGTRKPLPQVARELNVDGIVEGSVMRQGDRVRIRVQLIYAPLDQHLWAAAYERNLKDVFELEAGVAREIAGELAVELTSPQQARLSKTRTVNPEAYEAYLKGRYYAAKFTSAGAEKASDYFHQAIAIDPEYALPYEGLAYNYLFQSNWPSPPNQSMPKARDAAKKALELDDTLAGAHTSLAAVFFLYDLNPSAAERELKRALEINPSHSKAHYTLAMVWASMGRFEEAISENKRAQECDPVAEDARIMAGFLLYLSRRYDQAIQQLQSTIEMESGNWGAHLVLGRVHLQKRQFSEAIVEFQKAKQVESLAPDITAELGFAFAKAGKQLEAHKILTSLEMQSKTQYVPPESIALVWLGFGDKDRAFTWLEKAYTQHSPELALLKVDPDFDGIRSDPRFEELTHRIGVSQ